MSEHIPNPNKAIWLLFDLNNGDKRSKRYCWWFDTRKQAIEHRRWQIKQKYSASLSPPVKYVVDNTRLNNEIKALKSQLSNCRINVFDI